MSLNLYCCEGVKVLDKCTFTCCRKKPDTLDDEDDAQATSRPSPSKQHPPHMMMIQDLSLDLTVVSAPHRLLETLGDDTRETDPWDFMSVDKERRLVMLTGKRFLGFANKFPEFAERADACRGKSMDDVFPRGIIHIFNPLLTFSLQGDGGQLHSIYCGHSLTFFAYPFKNESGHVIGVHVVYRPTRYDAQDIAAMITTGASEPRPPAPTSLAI